MNQNDGKSNPGRKLTLVPGRMTLAAAERDVADSTSDLFMYRNRTTALLRRYLQLSVELGRVPSLLGREFFRSHVTSYRMHNFEDVVIFVHDVERCLEQLDGFSQQLIARVALQEHTYGEAARILGCTTRTVERRYPDALDELTEVLLDRELLQAVGAGYGGRQRRTAGVTLPPKKTVGRVLACQEGETDRLAINS